MFAGQRRPPRILPGYAGHTTQKTTSLMLTDGSPPAQNERSKSGHKQGILKVRLDNPCARNLHFNERVQPKIAPNSPGNFAFSSDHGRLFPLAFFLAQLVCPNPLREAASGLRAGGLQQAAVLLQRLRVLRGLRSHRFPAQAVHRSKDSYVSCAHATNPSHLLRLVLPANAPTAKKDERRTSVTGYASPSDTCNYS